MELGEFQKVFNELAVCYPNHKYSEAQIARLFKTAKSLKASDFGILVANIMDSSFRAPTIEVIKQACREQIEKSKASTRKYSECLSCAGNGVASEMIRKPHKGTFIQYMMTVRCTRCDAADKRGLNYNDFSRGRDVGTF